MDDESFGELETELARKKWFAPILSAAEGFDDSWHAQQATVLDEAVDRFLGGNGHLAAADLQVARDGYIPELDATPEVEFEKILLRQCLEWDADSGAIGATLADYMNAPGTATPWERVRYVLFATSALWRVFEDQLSAPQWDSSHPPLNFRRLSASAAIQRYLEVWANQDRDRFEPVLDLWNENLNRMVVLSLLTETEAGAQIQVIENKQAHDEIRTERFAALERKWTEIRPFLLKYKLGIRRLAD